LLARWILLASAFTSHALTNNLALTPPMGWNDWNTFGCGISETVVQQTADAMATNGMKAAGYQFVNVDDCWASGRDSNGVVVVNATKFPSGMKALADYLHSKGLKLGLYTDHGTNTCSSSNPPGSYGYEYVDAMTYAAWGVDYLKNDSCKLPAGDVPQEDYFRMADGLMKSGRAIVNSLCPNSAHYEYWSPDQGNMWRTTGDIHNTFSSMAGRIDPNSKSAYLAGPGRWNDADMLEVGNGEFTDQTNARSHFTMWCIMAAPLIAGNDIRSATPQTLAILSNPEAIAVDQDPAGEQGVRVGGTPGSTEVWSKPLGYDFTTKAVALFNRTTNAASITCTWSNLAFQNGPATVRDLWAHADLGTFMNSFTANVPGQGVVLLRIVGTPLAPPPLGTTYLSDLQPIYAYTGFGTLSKDTSIGGNTLTLNGVTYSKGIGTHAIGAHEYNLGGIVSRFQADLGVDDEVGSNGSVIFQVFADGWKIYDSGIMTGGSATRTVDLDVNGVTRLTLGVTDTGNDVSGNRNAYDHSDWAGARVTVTNTTPALPSSPTGLTAGPGNAINLSWNPARAAASYIVKRATVSGGPYAGIANVSGTIFTDTNVVVGVTYYYVLSATNRFGESTNTPQAAVTPCLLPGVPTNLTASVSNLQVALRWNSASGSYTIGRFTSSTPITNIASGITATNYTDISVTAGSTYFYIVAASNTCNQGAFSAFAGAIMPPAAPAGLTATPGNSQVILSWTAAAGATSYNLKRSTNNGGPYTVIANGVASAGYVDAGAANGATYYYVVSAVNSSGEGPNSAPASATPSAPVTAYWTNVVTASPQGWNVNGNWTNAAVFPNSGGTLAVINANIAAAQTINLNQAITVGALNIGDADGTAAYTIAGNGGALTFSDTNAVTLMQLASSKGDMIAAPVSMTTNLFVLNNSANPLTLAGTLSSSGGALAISSGVLQVGDGATNGSLGSVNVAVNSALVFNRNDSATNSGVISGTGSVAQKGTGILNLSGANTFGGGVTIQNGTLQAGNAAALGSTVGTTVITNGGTLDVNGFNLTGEAVVVSGSGVGGKGAIINGGGQQTSALRNVMLAGDITLGGAGPFNPSANVNRWDIRAVSNSSTNGCALVTGGHPYKLIKTGGNQISLVAVSVDPALGDVDIQQGLMGWETVTSSMGNPASNLIVRAGATLSFYNAGTAWNKHFILYGDGVSTNLYNWSGANVVIGPMQLKGDCVFWGGGTSLLLSNVVSGTGGLVKNGSYSLILAAANAYSGNTTVNAGNLLLTNNGAISGSAVINVGPGGTLDASGRSDGTLTLAGGQTLAGNGTVKGNVVVGSGATLGPGGSVGALTFSNSLTLNGGSTTRMEVSKSPVTNDVAQVTGNLTYGGTLVITNMGVNSFSAGDSFKLFNAGAYSGVFANLVPAIPGVNLGWNTNGLTNGVLSIVTAPTPTPRIGAVGIAGNDFILNGSNGVPNWPYYVLASTNAALPLSQWTRLATNFFDGGGRFNFTNTVNPLESQRYYLLQIP